MRYGVIRHGGKSSVNARPRLSIFEAQKEGRARERAAGNKGKQRQARENNEKATENKRVKQEESRENNSVSAPVISSVCEAMAPSVPFSGRSRVVKFGVRLFARHAGSLDCAKSSIERPVHGSSLKPQRNRIFGFWEYIFLNIFSLSEVIYGFLREWGGPVPFAPVSDPYAPAQDLLTGRRQERRHRTGQTFEPFEDYRLLPSGRRPKSPIGAAFSANAKMFGYSSVFMPPSAGPILAPMGQRPRLQPPRSAQPWPP